MPSRNGLEYEYEYTLAEQLMNETRRCIYCSETKSADQFSQEHIIPQFMGGSSECVAAVTHDVCKNQLPFWEVC